MTRIVRLVSLVPPLISIWGVRQAVSRAITRSLLTLRSELCLRSRTFSKKASRLKRNSLKIKSKSFSSNSFKNKPLSRTTVCEGNSTVENDLPTASCLKTNGNKFLSFTHRRLRGVYFPFLTRFHLLLNSKEYLFKVFNSNPSKGQFRRFIIL